MRYLQNLHVLTSVIHDRGPWLLFGELHAFTFIFLDPCDCFGTCPGVYATHLTSPCWVRIQAYWDPKQDKLVYKKDGWLDAMESPWREDVCVIRMTGNLFLLVCEAPMNSGGGQLPPLGPHKNAEERSLMDGPIDKTLSPFNGALPKVQMWCSALMAALKMENTCCPGGFPYGK